jgi:hypothetical protein
VFRILWYQSYFALEVSRTLVSVYWKLERRDFCFEDLAASAVCCRVCSFWKSIAAFYLYRRTAEGLSEGLRDVRFMFRNRILIEIGCSEYSWLK